MKTDLDSQGLLLSFANGQDEEEVFHQKDLVQLFPFGVSMAADGARPFLLLKDESHEFTLPVVLSPIEAGVTLTQTNPSALAATPHRFVQLLLETLQLQVTQCVFVQIKGAHQYVRIYFSGHPAANSIRLKAEEAMSLCLHLAVPIFATRKFIDRSRLLSAEIEAMGKGLRQLPQINQRKHTYLM